MRSGRFVGGRHGKGRVVSVAVLVELILVPLGLDVWSRIRWVGFEVNRCGSLLVMRIVVVPLEGRFLDGSVHPFDLPVGPGPARLGESVVGVVLRAGEREGVAAGDFDRYIYR
jgi:hypothetical protein